MMTMRSHPQAPALSGRLPLFVVLSLLIVLVELAAADTRRRLGGAQQLGAAPDGFPSGRGRSGRRSGHRPHRLATR